VEREACFRKLTGAFTLSKTQTPLFPPAALSNSSNVRPKTGCVGIPTTLATGLSMSQVSNLVINVSLTVFTVISTSVLTRLTHQACRWILKPLHSHIPHSASPCPYIEYRLAQPQPIPSIPAHRSSSSHACVVDPFYKGRYQVYIQRSGPLSASLCDDKQAHAPLYLQYNSSVW
jgi:hypothetical protein